MSVDSFICNRCQMEWKHNKVARIVTDTGSYIFCFPCLRVAHDMLCSKYGKGLDELKLLANIKKILRKKGLIHEKVS